MESIKRTVLVTIEKKIEIELTPAMFGGLTEEEYLADFSKVLWAVESIDDVIKYAARMAAYYGTGEYDCLGLIGPDHSTVSALIPDVKFRIILDECDEEIIPGEIPSPA